MNELINELFDIIKDYRKEDGDLMSKDIINNWINQFDENDREFLLAEMIHILKKRYLSKEEFKKYLKKTFFKDIMEYFNTYNIEEVLSRSHFINHQPEGKSQREIIKLFEEVITEEFRMTLADCEKEQPLCFIYLDDILCTGDTIFKGIADTDGWLDKKTIDETKTNRTYLEENDIPIFLVLYAIHAHNMDKLMSRISFAQKEHKIRICYFYQDEYMIDNNYTDPNSKLQYIFPVECTDQLVLECKDKIENKVDNYCNIEGYNKPEEHFFRAEKVPIEESLFSNPESRKRFETIILKKSIEVYNMANSSELRMRPLGYGLYTDKSFGYGTLLFSWRNIPFNTPLVFWYEHRGWQPLFKRRWSSYSSSIKEKIKFILKRFKS